jgi:hypothetical protein
VAGDPIRRGLRQRIFRASALAVVAAAALALVACGGGGGSSSTGPQEARNSLGASGSGQTSRAARRAHRAARVRRERRHRARARRARARRAAARRLAEERSRLEARRRRAAQTTTPAQSNCDPSYEGACLDPNASDYDCAGGSGNGPKYVSGPIRVVGSDHFDLDRDGDGVACE